MLGVPCLTLRPNTERPITTELGTSRVVGADPERIHAALDDVIERRWRSGECLLWDGRAGDRAAEAIAEWLARG